MKKVSGLSKMAMFMVKLNDHLENGGKLEHNLRNCQRIAEELAMSMETTWCLKPHNPSQVVTGG